ncbi:MAG: MFS transporter [Sandaracinaceae bacterium]
MTQASTSRADGPAPVVLFPPGIPFIVGNEGAERFSYYGMRAILYIYLAALYVQFLPEAQVGAEATADAEARATAVTHLFMAGVYAFPMVGAILADRLLGKYPVILWVSIIYCAGHAVLAVAGRFAEWSQFDVAEYGMYLGLILIAIGSGGIKPCVSANVGDQFTAKNQSLVTQVFQIFYFIINFGSFFSTLLTPYLYRTVGPEVAFGVPGIFMAIATFIFWLGRKKFVHVEPQPGGTLGLFDFASAVLLFTPVIAIIAAVFVVGGHFHAPDPEGMSNLAFYTHYVSEYLGHLAAGSWWMFVLAALLVVVGLRLFSIRQRLRADAGFLSVVLYAFRHRTERRPGEGFFAPAARKFGEEAAEGPPAVLRIMLVFSMVSVFWALFDQHASTWIEQAGQMNRTLTLPAVTFYAAVTMAIGLALYGGTALMAYVSNIRFPPVLHVVALGVAAAVVLVAYLIDLSTGATKVLELEAAQISALNPLMVMIIIPGLNVAVYQPLARAGIDIKPLQKMTVGMFLAAAAFAVAAILQMRIEALEGSGQSVHVLWQVVQYIVMTTSEVLVSVTGLEFAYTQAPRSMKSTIMGFWLLGVTFGNVLVAFLAPVQAIFQLSEFFWLFTTLAAFAAVIFAVLAYFYRGKTYLQMEAPETELEPAEV